MDRVRRKRGSPPRTNISATFQWIPNLYPSFCTLLPATHLCCMGERAVVPESRHKSLLRSASNPATVLGSSIPPPHATPTRNPHARPPSLLFRRRRRALSFTLCRRSYPRPSSRLNVPVLDGPCHLLVRHPPQHCDHRPRGDRRR